MAREVERWGWWKVVRGKEIGREKWCESGTKRRRQQVEKRTDAFWAVASCFSQAIFGPPSFAATARRSTSMRAASMVTVSSGIGVDSSNGASFQDACCTG